MARWLLQDFFFGEIFVIDLQWFRNITVAQVNDRWPPEQRGGLFIPTGKTKPDINELAANEAGRQSHAYL